MFKISVQTSGAEEAYGVDGAYRLIKEAGFDAVDANIDHLFNYYAALGKKVPSCFLPSASDSEVMEAVRPWRDAALKYGLENYQAHAPFPTYIPSSDGDEYNDLLIGILQKNIRACEYINCRNLIIHPFYCEYDQTVSREEEWEINIDRYMRLAPVAKEYGVTINLENMFTEHRGKIYDSTCSDGQEAARYVDTLNSLSGEKVFGFCLDTGHALLLGKDIREFMTDLGDRITAFHVHDNDGIHDRHQVPYSGVMDWNRFIDGLRDIGYGKTLSFESCNFLYQGDPELMGAALRYLAEIGRMFDRRASRTE